MSDGGSNTVSGTDDTSPDPSAAPMPPQRPASPQYGEYATPSEVSAARGIPLDRSNEHVDKLAMPVSPNPIPPTRISQTPIPRTPIPRTPQKRRAGSGLRQVPPPTGRPVAARNPAQTSSLITMLLLVFGIWNTVTSIPSFLDLGTTLSQGLSAAGYGAVGFGPAAHVAGILLLVFSFLVLLAAIALSLQSIRAGRPSIWIPLAAGAVWALGLVIAMVIVVTNTPGVTALLQNR